MLTTWNIRRFDVDSMKTDVLVPSGVYGGLGAATGAIEVGPRFWVCNTKSDRVGIFDLEP
jgi:hypothetical protein